MFAKFRLLFLLGITLGIALELGGELFAITPLEGHKNGVSAIAITADGSLIATGGKDRVIIVRNGKSGDEIRRFEGHKGTVTNLVFSHDQNLLASSSGKNVFFWQVSDGKQSRAAEHDSDVTSLTFSIDDGHLITGTKAGVCGVWDVATVQPLHALGKYQKEVTAIVLRGENGGIMAAAKEPQIKTWRSHEPPQTSLPPLVINHSRDGLASLAVRGHRFITGGYDKNAVLWEITGQGRELSVEEKARFKGHTGAVTFVTFGPDPGTVISASRDKTLQQWDVRQDDGATKKIWATHTFDASVTAGVTTDDCMRFVFLTADGTASLCNANELGFLVATEQVAQSKSPFAQLPAAKTISRKDETRSPKLVACSALNSFAVAFDDQGGEIRTLDGTKEQPFSSQVPVTSLLFNLPGDILIAGMQNGEIIGYDTQSGEELAKFTPHKKPVRTLSFTPDGAQIITGSDDMMSHLIDANNGNTLGSFVGHTGAVLAVAVSPDGAYVATASEDGTVRIWEKGNCQTIETIKKHTGSVQAITFSPSGELLVSGGDDKNVIVTRLNDMQEQTRFSLSDAITSLAFTPDGNTLIIGSREGSAVIVPTESWIAARIAIPREKPNATSEAVRTRGPKPLPAPIPVLSLSVTDGGKQFITTGGSATIIWDANETEK